MFSRHGSLVQLSLYLQYDKHVQQVIDEQVQVECDMATRTGRIVDLTATGPVHNIPVSVVQSYGVGTSWVGLQEEKEEEERLVEQAESKIIEEIIANDIALSETRPGAAELRKRGRMEEENGEAGPGLNAWLDITEAGQPVSGSVVAGRTVRLTGRVRGAAAQDSLLGNCRLQAGQQALQLTDERGCSVEPGLVSHTTAQFHTATGVMEMFANLRLPELPARTAAETLRVRCSLALCEDGCPASACDTRSPAQQLLRVRHSLLLETQALLLSGQEEVEEEEEESSFLLAGVDSQLCLSPTRIVLAFGVLIVIILISLLFSCFLWMKARRKMMPRPPVHPLQRGPPYIIPSRSRPYVRVLT